MSKILFIIPPYRTTDHLVSQLYPLPLGAVILGTILQEAGHSVVIKDFLQAAEKSKTATPTSFVGLGAHPAYMHFGTPLDQCLSWLRQNAKKFDAVLLAFQQCNIYETSAAIAQEIKSLGLPLMVGGAFATTAPEQVLKLSAADILVKGEAEEIIVSAVERLLAGDHGIIEGTIVDISKTPLPDWRLAPLDQYPKYEGKLRGVLTVTRGCPWGCKFCSVHTIVSRKHRRQAADRIKAELINLYNQGVRYFCFLDDNLFLNKSAVDEILSVIDELDSLLPDFKRCHFYVEEGMEVRVAAEAGIIKRIVEHRFDNVALGVETINDQRRLAMDKPYKRDQLRAAIKEINQSGGIAKAFYIIGFPGDTVESVCADLVEFGKLGLAARPNNLKLYPATEQTQMFLDKGWISKDYDWRLASWHTPYSGGLNMTEIRHLKTMLGAIGKAADAFGAALFLDDWDTLVAKFAAGKYALERSDQGAIRITGNMFRDSPFRHMAGLLMIRFEKKGYTSVRADNSVTALPLDEPADAYQAAVLRSLYPELQIAKPKPSDIKLPEWIVGDALDVDTLLPAEQKFDFILSCPPYHDLEQYSYDPRDLSNMDWDSFLINYREIIRKAVDRLKDNRFACFVVGEIRKPDGGGFYKNFIPETINAFEAAGAHFYNEMILVTAIGSLAIRVVRQFAGGRKIGKTHQNVLVFFKGDPATIKQTFPAEVPIADLEITADEEAETEQND